jgi:outer membrane protein assembly factor BamE (lipoprotein component of BamABCDE complex)
MGTKVDPNTVAQFKPGLTTYADVIGTLGKPNAEQYGINGVHAIKYVHGQAGLLGAAAQAYLFKFDANGVLQSVATSVVK